MVSIATDVIDGVSTSANWKLVRGICTTNITLSGLSAITTVEGSMTPADGDRFLLAGQTDATTRLIYEARSSAWTLAPDSDGARDLRDGTAVKTQGGVMYHLTTSDPIEPGTTSLTWERIATAILGDGSTSTVSTKAALTALTGMVDGQVVEMRGYYSAGDGGGGEFYWDSASSATDNGGTIIAPDAGGTGRWRRVNALAVTALQFGAKGDDSQNDYAYIQAALDACADVTLDAGKTFKVGTQINVASGKTLRGEGATLKPSSASVDVLLIQNSAKVLGHPTIDTTFVTYTGKAVTINTATALMNFNTRSVVTFNALGLSSQGTGLYIHNNDGSRYISGLVVDCSILRFDYGIDIYSQHASGFINGNEFRGNVYGAATALIRLRGAGPANGNRFAVELQPYTVSPFSAVGVQIDRGSNNSFITNFWDKAVFTTKPVVISGSDGAAASNTFHDLLQDLTQADITNTVGSVQNIVGVDWVGTWTPTITFGTPGDLSVAYTTRVGNYTKKGRRVTLDFNIVTSTFTHTTASGGLLITGLPYTSASVNASCCAVKWQGITKAGYTDMVATLGASEAFMLVVGSGSGVSASTVSAANMPTGGTVILNGTISYIVTGP